MIHWINEQIGTAAWDAITGQEGEYYLVDVRDLVDKEGNQPSTVRAKIDDALSRIRQGDKVVICCDYGMSRSNAVAAGVLSLSQNISLEEAVRQTLKTTGEKAIKIEVLAVVREALGTDPLSDKKKSNKRRLLLTGASGSIGSSLLPGLQAWFEVFAPERRQIDLYADTVALDLYVREHSIDGIFHLANPRIYTTNDSLGISLTMLKNVLDVCAVNRTHLFFTSSWAIYSGYKTLELKANETLPPFPSGTYPYTKYFSEMLVQNYCKQRAIPYTILRLSPIYGVIFDRPKLLWNFINKALRNDDIVTHKYLNGEPKLDLLYVDDLCSAVMSALQKDVQGVFNLGSGVGVSTTEIAKIIIELTRSHSKTRQIEINEYTNNIIMDYSHAQAVLDWHPTVNIREGLEQLINYKRGIQ